MKKKKVILILLSILCCIAILVVIFYFSGRKKSEISENNDIAILLNKKEIVFNNDGEKFLLIASLYDSSLSPKFSFSCDEKSIKILPNGDNQAYIERKNLFSDSIKISIKTLNLQKEFSTYCSVRCYNHIVDLGSFFIQNVLDDKGRKIAFFNSENTENITLKHGLTYEVLWEIKTLFYSEKKESISAIENEDFLSLQEVLKTLFENNTILTIREDHLQSFQYLHFNILYTYDLFHDSKQYKKSITFHEMTREYVFYNYEKVSSLDFLSNVSFVI